MNVLKREVDSLNTEVDISIRGQSFYGLGSYGTVEVGDAAFEYYCESNPRDYIQIPWEEVDHIAASVLFNKWISRFAIFTKESGTYKFSTRDNIKTLRAVRNHFPADKMLRSLNFVDVFRVGIASIPKAVGQLFHKTDGGSDTGEPPQEEAAPELQEGQDSQEHLQQP